jgi:hypothetical protein
MGFQHFYSAVPSEDDYSETNIQRPMITAINAPAPSIVQTILSFSTLACLHSSEFDADFHWPLEQFANPRQIWDRSPAFVDSSISTIMSKNGGM